MPDYNITEPDFDLLTQVTQMAIDAWREDGQPSDHESYYYHGELVLLAEVAGWTHEQEDGTDQDSWTVTVYPVYRAGGDPNTDIIDRDNPLSSHSFQEPDN